MDSSIIQFALPIFTAGLFLIGSKNPEPENPETGTPEIGATSTFLLNPEVDLNALQKSKKVDVNLGHAPKAFIQALWKPGGCPVPPDGLIHKGRNPSGVTSLRMVRNQIMVTPSMGGATRRPRLYGESRNSPRTKSCTSAETGSTLR